MSGGLLTHERLSAELSEANKSGDNGQEERAGLQQQTQQLAREIGGPTGPEPTRFGDWEKNGRCIDF
jgi:hypothetical protein